MKLDELKTALQGLLTETSRKNECVDMLAAIGFVPQAEKGEPIDLEKIKAEARDEGLKEGRKKEATRVKGILNACSLAGRLDMAAGLIESGAGVEEAGKKIIEARAEADEQTAEVTSTVGALPRDSNPLMADAMRRSEQSR